MAGEFTSHPRRRAESTPMWRVFGPSAPRDADRCEISLPSYHRGAGRADRGGRENTSRKVRTPQGRAVGNAHPGKPAGQCHRKDTADGATAAASRTGNGEMV